MTIIVVGGVEKELESFSLPDVDDVSTIIPVEGQMINVINPTTGEKEAKIYKNGNWENIVDTSNVTSVVQNVVSNMPKDYVFPDILYEGLSTNLAISLNRGENIPPIPVPLSTPPLRYASNMYKVLSSSSIQLLMPGNYEIKFYYSLLTFNKKSRVDFCLSYTENGSTNTRKYCRGMYSEYSKEDYDEEDKNNKIRYIKYILRFSKSPESMFPVTLDFNIGIRVPRYNTRLILQKQSYLHINRY